MWCSTRFSSLPLLFPPCTFSPLVIWHSAWYKNWPKPTLYSHHFLWSGHSPLHDSHKSQHIWLCLLRPTSNNCARNPSSTSAFPFRHWNAQPDLYNLFNLYQDCFDCNTLFIGTQLGFFKNSSTSRLLMRVWKSEHIIPILSSRIDYKILVLSHHPHPLL